MDRQEIENIVLQLPEVAAWPELSGIFAQAMSHPRRDWELPLMSAQAVGGDTTRLAPVAAALICTQLSITLVDDILDQDPRGAHLQIGEGRTANIALALQAIGFALIERLPLVLERRSAITFSLARMSLGTALGQSLDVLNLEGEENYWKVVRTKSTPYYATSLQVGALAGGATVEVTDRLYAFGALIGEIIQVYDDLADALQKPANPDWTQNRPNLAILYARVASHRDRERFQSLMSRIGEPGALEEAQRILIRSGAISYCSYQVVKRYQAAQRILAGLVLTEPQPLNQLLAHQLQPLRKLLEGVGAAIPHELE